MKTSMIERYLRSSPASIIRHDNDSSSNSSITWIAMGLQEFKDWIGQPSGFPRVGILSRPFFSWNHRMREWLLMVSYTFWCVHLLTLQRVIHSQAHTVVAADMRFEQHWLSANWMSIDWDWRLNWDWVSSYELEDCTRLLWESIIVEFICIRILFDLWSMVYVSLLKVKEC